MRILHVSHAIAPDANTGVETYTAQLARAQRQAGHEVAIFTRGLRTDVPSGTVETSDADGVTVVRTHHGPNSGESRLRVRRDMDAHFARFLAEWKPDVVHFQHLLFQSLTFPELAKTFGAATVLTLHDFWYTCPVVQRRDFAGRLCGVSPGAVCLACVWGGRKSALVPPALVRRLAENPLSRPLLNFVSGIDELADWQEDSRRALGFVDTVISPSRFVADDLTGRGIEPARLVLSDYGIPRPNTDQLGKVRRARPDDGVLHLGVIGSHSLKGAHVAVEAFRRLPANVPIRLHVWGGAEQIDVPARVTLEGRFTADDLETVYGGFDALIVPSIWYENAPFVIREAFARSLPVICSDIGGMAESVRDGVDGLHFRVNDPDALAEALCRLIEHPQLLPGLREGIRPPKFYDQHVAEMIEQYSIARWGQERPA